MREYQSVSAMMVYMDALFDTRLSLLYELNPSSLLHTLTHDYLVRDEEKFPDIDKTLFFDRYHARDKSLLKNATVTPVMDMLVDFIRGTYTNNISGPILVRPKIILNTWPYELSREECNTLKQVITIYTKDQVEVEVVHVSYSELTPSYLKREVSIVVMYDYYRWLEVHSESKRFETDRCPDISLIAPGIYFKGKPNRSQIELAKEVGMTPLGIIEAHAGPFIDLKLVNIDVFCSKILKRKSSTPTTLSPD